MNTLELNRFVVILIYGSLVLLSILTLANPLKVNKKANIWFGLFLFLWSSFWLDEVWSLIKSSDIEIHSILLVQFIQFLTPIMFYFSVLFFSNPSFKFKVSDIKYALLPGVFLANLLLQRFGNFEDTSIFGYVFIGLILFQALFYTGLSYLTIRKHQKRIQQFSSNTEGINLNWLEYIILIIFIINIVYVIYNLSYDSTSLNAFINIAFFDIHILINNAGLGGTRKFVDATPHYINTILQVNVMATSLMTHQLLPNLMKQPKAYILNVSSMAAFSPIGFKTVYPASKTFIHSFSRGLHEELKGTNVFVSVVNPGAMKTNQDVCKRIEKQGFLGKLTLLDPNKVAGYCINQLFKRDSVIMVNPVSWLIMKILPIWIKLPLMTNAIKKEIEV